MYSFDPFCIKLPTSIILMCVATMQRFAESELRSLHSLRDEILNVLGTNIEARLLVLKRLPGGKINFPPMLNTLLDCVESKGCFSKWKQAIDVAPPRKQSQGIQAYLYSCFACAERADNLGLMLTQKLVTTLGAETSSSMQVRVTWYEDL